MLRLLMLSVFALVAVAAVAWGTVAVAAEVISRSYKPRGELVDIGGRKLRLVCEGPKGAAPVVCAWSAAAGSSDICP